MSCIKTAAAIECSIACAAEAEKQVAHNECALVPSHEASHEHAKCCSIPDLQAEKSNHGQNQHHHAHDADGKHLDAPCNDHLRAAMDRYATYLETARCICRSILKSAGVPPNCSSQLEARSNDGPSFPTRHHLNLREHKAGLKRLRAQSAAENLARHEHIKSCDSRGSSFDIVRESKATEVRSLDLEKAAGPLHVLLNVAGMDCSGCANNLTRALSSVEGVGGVNAVFVNGTAEFDIDTKVVNVEDVIRRAQRATGYKLTPFSSDTQALDVVMSEAEAGKLQNSAPRGVVGCEKLAKTVYEISYDPCIIGVRDIMATIDAQLAPPRGDSYLDAGIRKLIRVSIMTTLSFMFTIPVVALEWGKVDGIPEHTISTVGLVLATMVQAIAIPEFYKPAISSLVYNKVVEMDMLVVISITAAYGYSVVALGLVLAGVDLETSPFFETSTLLISLILLGRLLAAWARKRAVKAVSLRSLQASTATLIDQPTGEPRKIDARLLQFGDVILIQPHSQIVTDADVLNGTSEVDESMLTGESVPVFKRAGNSVVSGTVNGGGTLTARVARLPGKNTITDIANLVEQAQSLKPRIQDLADKVAGYFIPVVCTAALIVFIVWIVVGLKVRNQSAGGAIGTAIGYCIAVLAVSCPCALGLAVPMVLVVAGGVAARGGVIIKTADVIECGFKVTDVVFDKTGTLTQPELELVQEVILPTDQAGQENVRSLVMCMTSGNKHPVSQTVAASLKTRGTPSIEVKELTTIPGCGVQAEWQGRIIRAGNAKWLQIDQQPKIINFAARGLTMLCVTVNDELVAMFGLKAVLRVGAASVVQELNRRQITVHIVSGDASQAVQTVARDLNISMENVAAERTPAEKQEYIRRLMESGKITLFCGDGTNDAVAVAQANVGVQIESSSDVTRATADVILLRNLDGVVNLLDVSKAAFRRIIFNFIWSAIYNVLAMLLAGGAFVKVRIPPAYAGLGEIVSVMPVIITALTMPKAKRGFGGVLG